MVEKQLSTRLKRAGKEIAQDTGYLARQAAQAVANRVRSFIPQDVEQRVLARGYAGGASGNTLLDLPYIYYASKRALKNRDKNRYRYEVDKLSVEVAKLRALKQQKEEIDSLRKEKERLERELQDLK